MPSEERCVVCRGALADRLFSNAWERSLGVHPCCSASCVDRFDPDVHWMPATAPAPLPEDEARRLMDIARRRMESGDEPTLVVRDLLMAGVPAWQARATLTGAAARAEAYDRRWRDLAWLGALTTWLGPAVVVRDDDRGAADPASVLDANAIVDAWEARFERDR